MALRDQIREAHERFVGTEIVDLVPRLTLMFLLVYRVGTPEIRLFLIVIGIAGLIFPPLHRSAWLWFAAALVTGVRVFLVGHNLDNHGYLTAYWCLALACAYSLDDPRKALAIQGRLLVGWCFFFATLWKGALAHDFMSGDFLHLTYLNDLRLERVTLLLGGLDEAALAENRALVRQLREASLGLESVTLQTTQRIYWLAIASAWWTVIIEGIVAVLFLLPVRFVPALWRDGSLLLFGFTTYIVTPIMGFGWLLMVMGIAQTRPEDVRTRLLYLLACVVIAIYKYA